MPLGNWSAGAGGAFNASDLTTLYHVPAATATALVKGLYSAPGFFPETPEGAALAAVHSVKAPIQIVRGKRCG